MARPSIYSEEKAGDICAQIASGLPLTRICKAPGMPVLRTVYRWLMDAKHEAFSHQYAQARLEQADTLADQMMDIADRATTAEEAQIARVQIDTRKWIASKMKPKKYGDRIAQEIDATITSSTMTDE